MDIEQQVAIVCTIRDGKAVRWQIYPSRDEAIAEASAEPRA
jgi:ketosteroid isomerase-like protein